MSNAPLSSALTVSSPQALARPGGRDAHLAAYLRRIRQIEPLTPEREHELLRRYRDDGDREAGEHLVVANLMSVIRIARRYSTEVGGLFDLIQEGNVGLLRALDKYDPTRGIPFSAYARYWIRAMILRYLMENHRLVKVGRTRDSRRVFFQIARERAELERVEGHATPAQLAERLGVDRAELDSVVGVLSPEKSLDVGPDGTSMYEVIEAGTEDPEQLVQRHDLIRVIRGAVDTFSETLDCEREQALLADRLLADEPASLATLGRRFGLTRERMRQLEQRLKDRLRAFLVDELGAEAHLSLAA